MTISTPTKNCRQFIPQTIRGRQDGDIYPPIVRYLRKLCVEEGQTVRQASLVYYRPGAYLAALRTQQKPMWKLPVPA